jgi:hypothetical protein
MNAARPTCPPGFAIMVHNECCYYWRRYADDGSFVDGEWVFESIDDAFADAWRESSNMREEDENHECGCLCMSCRAEMRDFDRRF